MASFHKQIFKNLDYFGTIHESVGIYDIVNDRFVDHVKREITEINDEVFAFTPYSDVIAGCDDSNFCYLIGGIGGYPLKESDLGNFIIFKLSLVSNHFKEFFTFGREENYFIVKNFFKVVKEDENYFLTLKDREQIVNSLSSCHGQEMSRGNPFTEFFSTRVNEAFLSC